MEFGGVPPILVFPYPEDIRKTNLLMVEEAQNPFRTVVQLVRILACHASGRGFDSRQSCQTMGILPPSVMAWVKDTFLTRWAEAWVFPQTMNVAFRKAIIRLGLAAPQWVTSYSPSVHRSD